MTDIRLRDVPELQVVSEQRSVTQPELAAWIPGAMARVADRARAAGALLGTADWPFLDRPADPGEPVFVAVYGGNPNEGPTPVTVCATVPSGGDQTLPAHREAYARVTKSLVTTGALGGVYEAVEKWATGKGLTITGLPRETYWTDFTSAAPDDEVLDVAFPVSS